MISIVIASVNEKQLQDIKLNISQTIGVAYELIVFENSNGERGLCAIYNQGASEAKYELVCFMHEDIELKTKDWGKIVVDLFTENEKLGVVGVAGSAYKSLAPSGWGSESFEKPTNFFNYIQYFKRSETKEIHAYYNPNNVKFEKVVAVDGMWMCSTKTVVSRNPFDDDLFKGFHCYDLDFCLNVGSNYDIIVSFEVLMAHFSEGGYDKTWFFETLKLHEKWEGQLPRCTISLTYREKQLIEKRAYKRIISKLVELNFKRSEIINFLNQQKTKFGIDRALFLKLKFYLIKFIFFGKRVK